MAVMANNAAEVFSAAANGDARSLARLLSWVECGSDALRGLDRLGASHVSSGYVIGITGAPGVGKSSCTAALIGQWRSRNARVAVLAVDPSSPFSGGALLGDRVRMQDHVTDSGVFIRSMASRGHLGGLSAAVPEALSVLEAVGFDVIIVETVGVGQAEVDIAMLADTTLVLLAPGMGDGVQSVKAGILEIADVYVVNKADRAGADSTVSDLKALLALGGRHSVAGSWRPHIVSTVATTGSGIDELMAACDAHRKWLARSDGLHRRRIARCASQLEALMLAALRARVGSIDDAGLFAQLAEQVARGDRDPYEAAAALLASL